MGLKGNKMQEQIISFETSKILYRLNIKLKSNWVYDKRNGFKYSIQYHDGLPTDDTHICAPSQSLLQKWLREEHDIEVNCRTNIKHDGRVVWESSGKYFKLLHHTNKRKTYSEYKRADTYEKALEKGLQEGLKLIK